MTNKEIEGIKTYFVILCIICFIVLIIAYINHNFKKTDQLVEAYAESCQCREIKWEYEGEDVVIEDCLCPVYPE